MSGVTDTSTGLKCLLETLRLGFIDRLPRLDRNNIIGLLPTSHGARDTLCFWHPTLSRFCLTLIDFDTSLRIGQFAVFLN